METTGLKPIDELTILATDGNGLAFTALWDRHINQLTAFLKSSFPSLDEYNVDDICSRTFKKAFRKISSYAHTKGRFLTWLCTIGKNMNTNPDQEVNALENLIHNENEEEKTEYINRLPGLYREVAGKRMLEGMKYNEIAECMDINLNTVKTRISRAKELIDKMRKEDEKESL